ncbi:phage tail protein I [Asticcacaulis sp. BYS171W]|uniref:Phage tail protein I n=1 Tax=Asticcacaulis aquaticus TaxID=2984212 RepID=A0ABT5HTE5_9CAUL|nr:phage tail protein I [Asticcacaulis aquaticus]MDC7683274.1 phage tail protein I [Asticcacaulis aquaticus]
MTDALSLLPPNAKTFERALESAMQASPLPRPIRALWSADECPVDLLPWLAWGLSVENWSPAWPESVKRARVRDAIYIQQIKGTRQAVEDVIELLGGVVELREWFEMDPPGEPYTFELVITFSGIPGVEYTAEYAQSLIEEVNRTKPLRSHFTFVQSVKADGRIILRAVARAAGHNRLTADAVAPAPAWVYLTAPEPGGDYLLSGIDYLFVVPQ